MGGSVSALGMLGSIGLGVVVVVAMVRGGVSGDLL